MAHRAERLVQLEVEPDWNGVVEVLSKHHYRPDLDAARALYAAIAAHRLQGAPVWPMMVAPPGSMKTVLLEALDGLPQFHFIDRLTPNTFLSGQLKDPKQPKGTRSPSLLHRIGQDGVVVYADFSTILGMHRDHRNSILADMRRIYDGKLVREFGTTQGELPWTGRLTFAAACTPQIDSYFSVFQALGERFIQIRPARPDGVKSAESAMTQDRNAAKADLLHAVHALFTRMSNLESELDRADLKSIACLAEFTVKARTHVPRLSRNKEIEYVPEAEAPTRLGQQLAQLAKGSAMVGGRERVLPSDLMLVRRVAFDCIPPVRRKILDALSRGQDFGSVDLPPSTKKYAADDLEALGLLTTTGRSKALSDRARQLLAGWKV